VGAHVDWERQMKMRKCEPQQLIPYVIEAVKAMKLIPAKTNGVSFDVWISVPFVYPK
jgi:hypothetical protein